MKKKKPKKKFVITPEQIRKMEKAAERQVRLENGEYRPTSQHKTSKKDIQDKQSNTIKDYD